jgi:hypothetical protein
MLITIRFTSSQAVAERGQGARASVVCSTPRVNIPTDAAALGACSRASRHHRRSGAGYVQARKIEHQVAELCDLLDQHLRPVSPEIHLVGHRQALRVGLDRAALVAIMRSGMRALCAAMMWVWRSA